MLGVVTTLLSIADELYALPLAEFTAARDARVKQEKAGDKELSAAVKALKKPSTAAWAVNQLVRHETEQVDQVLAVGEALREAQRSLDGAELRALTRQRRQLTAAVTGQARAVCTRLGTRLTDAVTDQVEATLTAAMVDAEAARAVRSGLLIAALSSTGMEAVDPAPALAVPQALGFEAAAVEPTPPTLHVVPDPEPDETAVRAAQERVAETESAHQQAAAAATEAHTAVSELEARSLQLQGRLDELRRQVAEAESEAEEIDDELSDAEDSADEADREATRTEQELDQARKALEKLT